MRGKYLFEYAVVRLVPRVEREEFLNVGVVLYCRDLKFLDVRFTLNTEKLHALCPEVDTDNIARYLTAFEHICRGLPDSGPIAQFDIASRFRWLTANRSTVIQASKVHPGFCDDPAEMLEKLHRKLVL